MCDKGMEENLEIYMVNTKKVVQLVKTQLGIYNLSSSHF